MKKIIVLMIIILALPLSVKAADWPNPVYLSAIADSIWRIPSVNGSKTADSTKRTNVQSYDTTQTVTDGNQYQNIYKIWYQGEDSATSWVWYHDRRNDADIDSAIAALADASIGDKAWTDGSFTARGYLDVSVSSRSTYDPATDSAIVDMSSFNASLDNDSTLLNFLRAGIGSSGDVTISDASLAVMMDSILGIAAADTVSGRLLTLILRYSALAGDTSLWADINPVIDSLEKILDSLYSHDNWVSSLTENSNIGIDLDDVLGTLDADEIGPDAITASKIANNAIGASELAIDAIGSDELSTLAIAEINGEIHSHRDDYKATGFSTHSAADIWAIGSRTTTGQTYDFDSTHFASSTFATWLFTTGYFDSAQGSASGLTAADIWNVPFNYGHDAGSMGDSLNNPSYVQGTASGLTPADIWAYATRALTDKAGFSLAAGQMTEIGDTAYGIFTNGSNEDQFKADVSALSSAANMSLALDSLGKILDSIYAIIDTLQNQDNWIATQADLSKALDSLGKIIDSCDALSGYTNDSQDSIYAILDSIQLYLDVAVSSVTGNWTAGQRDSVLNAIEDASFIAKIWNIAWSFAFTAGSIGDSVTTAAYVQGTAAGLTPADIWAYVTREITGGYVDSNVTEQGGSAGGDGAYSYTAVIIDTSSGGSAPVADAPCYINNIAQSGTPYFDLTDVNGAADGFQLDAGTYVFIMNKAGYASLCDTFSTTGIDADTFYTHTSDANKTVVYGTILDARGQYAAYGRVKFRAIPYPGDSLIYIGDTLVTQTIVEDTANAYGYFQLPLMANANFTSPDSTYYQAMFYDRYNRLLERSFFCIVPDTAEIAINYLMRWR